MVYAKVEASWIARIMVATLASIYPLSTARCYVVRAMSRICPAVVECPHNLCATRFKVVEECGVVQIVSMQVVKVDDVGLDSSQLIYEVLRGASRPQAVSVEKTRECEVPCATSRRAHGEKV